MDLIKMSYNILQDKVGVSGFRYVIALKRPRLEGHSKLKRLEQCTNIRPGFLQPKTNGKTPYSHSQVNSESAGVRSPIASLVWQAILESPVTVPSM